MQRYLARYAGLIGLLLLIWLLSVFFEPRKTAYSCRTVWSCIGITSVDRTVYKHAEHPELSIMGTEEELRNGDMRFVRYKQTPVKPELLILVVARDGRSWSKDFRSTQRTVYDFVDVLASTKLDMTTVSLGMATNDPKDYKEMQEATKRLPFANTALLALKEPADEVPYELRHNPATQLARRAAIAKLRNRLMLSTLQDEPHIIWLDADVVELSPGIVQAMIEHSLSNEKAGIITAMCHQNQMDNYDKNAWKINSPNVLGPIMDDDRDEAVQQLVAERQYLPELSKDLPKGGLISLDSVGGTILYMRADLVRHGLTFPYMNAVGTTWSQQGWIGVETEGLCYMAKELEGGGCFALGSEHWVRHTDWG